MSERMNATIKRVSIDRDGPGILTMWIALEGAGWGISFGGYALDQYDKVEKRRVGTELLALAVLALMDTFEVDDLAKLTGLPCRVDLEGWGGKAQRIGHFTKDRWFSWQELCDKACGRTS